MDDKLILKLSEEIKAICEKKEYDDFRVEVILINEKTDTFAVFGDSCHRCMFEEFQRWITAANVQHDTEKEIIH